MKDLDCLTVAHEGFRSRYGCPLNGVRETWRPLNTVTAIAGRVEDQPNVAAGYERTRKAKVVIDDYTREKVCGDDGVHDVRDAQEEVFSAFDFRIALNQDR